ncbi:MAG: hypothetical protein M1838_000210 [Thelocarpon superellum]|nr:MAG: hypothetical protein M1838_000210 [Thelocarpon superellum]
MTTTDDPLWLFGYGEDHRGTPEAPGRVVTLIERAFWETLGDQEHVSTSPEVWGVAYRIQADKVDDVRAYLDLREINGYSIHHASFQPADPHEAPIRTLVYIGTPENPQFVGPQDPQRLAEHIFRSRGPSGENKEYLFMMAHSLDELCPANGDEHVRDLAQRVRRLEVRGHGGPIPDGPEDVGAGEPTGRHGAQEEVEKDPGQS